MRRVLTTIALTVAAVVLMVNFRTRAPEPSAEALAALEPVVTTTRPPRPTTTTMTTRAAPTTTTTVIQSKWYATTTTYTMPPPRDVGTTTTTTQAPMPTSATAEAFTGSLVDTDFGPIQVQIIVANGVIEDVIPVELPLRYHTSRSISRWSWKVCRVRTLEANGSDFAKVAGATVTWRAYVESLDVATELAGLMP